jgi:pSer/pThr/pTyr-binding forkhead associated (FHA) protein
MISYLFLLLRIAILLILFTFLGYALWVMWVDLNQKSKKKLKPNHPAITLVSNKEESDPNRFLNSPFIIGRDPASGLRLSEPTISAKHAKISYHHRQWWVEDLNSTNGTYLNDEPVTTPLVLATNDQLRCGDVNMDVFIEEEKTNE